MLRACPSFDVVPTMGVLLRSLCSPVRLGRALKLTVRPAVTDTLSEAFRRPTTDTPRPSPREVFSPRSKRESRK
eukprot:1180686-Prorocentrum_minimum.AAC.1